MMSTLVLAVAFLMVMGPQMAWAQELPEKAAAAAAAAVRPEPVYLDGETKQRIDASKIEVAPGTMEIDDAAEVMKVAVRAESMASIAQKVTLCTIQHWKQLVYRNGCKGTISSHMCYGHCFDYTYMWAGWGSNHKYEYRYCKCCRTDFSNAVSSYFQFTCPNGQIWYYPYTVVKGCKCQSCDQWQWMYGPY